MKLSSPIVRLGPVPCDDLVRLLESTDPDLWQHDQRRQDLYSDFHGDTQSIILVFCEGWPNVRVSRESGWGVFGEATADLIFEVLKRHYLPGGLLLRAMLARLPAGARIRRHRDAHPSFAVAHRIHVPLLTNAKVTFLVEDCSLPPEPGIAFEIDNLLPHEVNNGGGTDRVHLVFDYAPASMLAASKP